MTVLLALGGLGLLLVSGLLLWLGISLLRRLALPVPLIGGFVGLAAGPFGLDLVPREAFAIWTALPSVLINFVFAGLFLGVTVPPLGAVVRLGGPLVRFSVVGALGQYIVGLLLTGLVLGPLFGTPALFGCLIEVGFAGGHGTAGAMASVFVDLGFPAGGALAQMSATVGLIAGVVGGVALIQHGVRRGVTRIGADADGLSTGAAGLVPPGSRRSIATGTITSDVLEPFALHVAILTLATLAGWVMLQGVRAVHPSLGGFPLFPLAMIGGMLIQALSDRLGAAAYFDRDTFQRITGLCLDLLVVAAIASLQLDLFLQNVLPFTLLMIAGIAWCVVSFLVLAPRMLREFWFEQGLVVYGTQTGVAAVGLMLLRIVDPHNRTTAAQAFAARSMVTSPLLGGGLVTATMPLMVQQFGLWPVLAVLVMTTLLCYFWPGRRSAAP
jgi:glutamate:Na+ symporter, ESS family